MSNSFKILPLLIAATEVARGIQTNQKNQDACSNIQTLLMSSERCQYFSIKFIWPWLKPQNLIKLAITSVPHLKSHKGQLLKRYKI